MIGRIGTYVRRHHVALLALFFALVGTSRAASTVLLPKNSVGSAQVINGSLQKRDLSKNAVVALRGNQGPQGPQGAAGPAGAAGAVGPVGPPGVSGYQVVTATARITNGTVGEVAASCPAGKTVLGGGVSTPNTGVEITASAPDGTSWKGGAFNGGGGVVFLTTFAVCASVS
jgi:hypothetical protein